VNSISVNGNRRLPAVNKNRPEEEEEEDIYLAQTVMTMNMTI